MTALIYKDVHLSGKSETDEEVEQIRIGECALVLVSDEPIFKVQKQILELIYQNAILENIKRIIDNQFHRPLSKENSLEFYLSLIFHHLKMDSSNLQFVLRDSQESLIQFENNLTQKCFKLENFDFNDLFMMVKPQFIVEIFICILHERKIIIVNNDVGMNASLM